MNKLIADYTIVDCAYAFLCVLLIFGIASTLASGISNHYSIGLDDTDKDAYHRSGVSVVTDYKTGMQYLKTPDGFLTPRLGVK